MKPVNCAMTQLYYHGSALNLLADWKAYKGNESFDLFMNT
jgi:hypothetical protein